MNVHGIDQHETAAFPLTVSRKPRIEWKSNEEMSGRMRTDIRRRPKTVFGTHKTKGAERWKTNVDTS